MQLRHEITYDAPADAVWQMLADPAFRERSCDAMGVLDREIEIVPHQPAHDRVDMRRVSRPQGSHRRLVALDGALDQGPFVLHDVEHLVTSRGHKGLPNGRLGYKCFVP